MLDDVEGYVLAKIEAEMPAGALLVTRQVLDKTGSYTPAGSGPVTVPAR
jgi:hypothetical protein